LRYLLLAIATLVLAPLPALAADVLIVQSSHSSALDQMTRMVQNDCSANHRTLVLSDYADADIARLVREERPSVVVAIGDRALAEVKKIRKVPVVYGMALNTAEEILADNVSGISMAVSPDSYMKLFSSLKLRRIGVIHDRMKTGAYMNRARAAAERTGIELVTLQVRSAKDVPQKLFGLNRKSVDAIWLIPDTTAITPETVDSYFTVAQQNDLPVIGFSPAYLSKGALASLELTRQELGKQLCGKIRTSRSDKGGGTTDPSRGKLLFNDSVARRLGIVLPNTSRLAPELLSDE